MMWVPFWPTLLVLLFLAAAMVYGAWLADRRAADDEDEP